MGAAFDSSEPCQSENRGLLDHTTKKSLFSSAFRWDLDSVEKLLYWIVVTHTIYVFLH